MATEKFFDVLDSFFKNLFDINLEDITLSEMHQTQNNKYCMILLT